MLITQGQSEAVIVTAVDEDGQSLIADFSVSNIGAGITATVDPNFLPVVGSNPIQRQGRIVVTAVGVTSTTFTVNALGLTKDIRVRTTLPGNLAATISNLAPALGEQITITMPPGTFLTSTSLVTFGVQTPIVISTAPDGTSITLIPPPNVNLPASISDVGVVSTNLTFDIATTDVLVTPAVTAIASTVSSTTPAGGVAVTLTSTDATLTFSDAAVVVVGLDTAITNSVAAGGQSMTFVPTPGSTGALTVVRVLVAGLDFGLSLPSTAPAVTAGATVTPIAGTGSTATAPTLQLPAAGTSRGFVDAVTAGYAGCAAVGTPAFAVPCQIYKLVLPADGTVNITARWEGTSDVGIYMLASDGVTVVGTGGCDAAAAQPETCAQALTAGTYFLAVVPFGPVPLPQWVKVRIATPAPAP